VDDALAIVAHVEIGQTIFSRIGIQGFHLQARSRVGNAIDAVGGRHIVVGNHQIGCYPPRFAPGQLEPVESLRAGDFVQQMPIDIQYRGTVFADVYNVRIPKFVVERLGHVLAGIVCKYACKCLDQLSIMPYLQAFQSRLRVARNAQSALFPGLLI
jgi:hypothetical protein